MTWTSMTMDESFDWDNEARKLQLVVLHDHSVLLGVFSIERGHVSLTGDVRVALVMVRYEPARSASEALAYARASTAGSAWHPLSDPVIPRGEWRVMANVPKACVNTFEKLLREAVMEELPPLGKQIASLGACTESLGWLAQRADDDEDVANAWNTCEQSDWMHWLCNALGIKHDLRDVTPSNLRNKVPWSTVAAALQQHRSTEQSSPVKPDGD